MRAPLSDQADPPSVYTQAAPPAPPTSALTGRKHVGVAVIGAGFTGLSAALHLAEAGVEVAVLEAKEIGWGASGRAFGQVVPYLKIGHRDILRHYGPERGSRVIDAIAAGPDLVFELIARHGIDCWAVRTGLIFAAHAPAGRHELEARTAYWQQRGAPVEMLEGAACTAAVGSSLYAAASLDRRGGNLNPFAYARGLARAAVAAGAAIHPRTPVRGISRRDGRWVVDAGADGGANRRGAAGLTADAVLLATNAYTGGIWPGLRESIIPLRGHGFVSAPLSDNVQRSILPGRQSLTDTRRLFSGVRMLPDGRLHGSAYGPIGGPERAADFRRVDGRMRRLFPQLGAVQWQEAWSGWVAMTTDHVPRVHALAPGVWAGLGYNGRGIAAATLMGRELAARARGAGDDTLVFPLVPVRPLPWVRAAPFLVGALARWYRVLDVVEELRFLPRG
jgi:glycine/D-amino acid oxidase-like deaminating enzyme